MSAADFTVTHLWVQISVLSVLCELGSFPAMRLEASTFSPAHNCVCVCGKSAARSLLNPDVLSLRVFTHTHAHCRVKSTGMLCSDLRFLQWGLCLSSALEMQIKLYYSNSGRGREGTDASGQHARTRSQCVCVKFIR